MARAASRRPRCIGAVPPVMVKNDRTPAALPIEVFDGFRAALAANRAQFFMAVPAGPVLRLQPPGREGLAGHRRELVAAGHDGRRQGHYDCIKAFSETDFTEDLKADRRVPVLVMHGDDDQVVPIADSALLTVKLLKNGTLKVYKGFPHGMATTHADVINADLLAFIES